VRVSRFLTLCAASVIGLCGVTAGAVAAGDPKSCATIADDAARLACYDAAVGRTPSKAAAATPPAQQVSRAAPPAVAAAPVAAAPVVAAPTPAPKDPVSEFGLSESAKAARDPVKQAEAAAAPQSVSARVISVRWRKYGEFVVTLDNGQVWAQIEPMPSAIVKVGDVVTVKKALFGSYTLVTAGKIGTKVRRLD
jgi:hypothetical protein